MIRIKILYDEVIKELEAKTGKVPVESDTKDNLDLVVVRGYPIGNYVPIIDAWPIEKTDQVYFDRLSTNEEICNLQDIMSELLSMNGKEIVIEEGFRDMKTFLKVTSEINGSEYWLDNGSFLHEYLLSDPETQNFSYLTDIGGNVHIMPAESESSSNVSDFYAVARKLCNLLDNVNFLKQNEEDGLIAEELAEKLLRLAR